MNNPGKLRRGKPFPTQRPGEKGNDDQDQDGRLLVPRRRGE